MTPALRPLLDGLALLEILSDEADPQGVSGLAQRLGWPKSRVHRVITALTAAGYAQQDADRRYRASVQVLRLAAGVMGRHPLRRIARPELRALCAATGCDATMSVLHRERSLAIAVETPDGRAAEDPFAQLGRSSHLHGAANGKVLLAWMPLAESQALLARLDLPRLTARTITGRARLAAELEQVRMQGFALNDRENHPEVATVSVPVFDPFHRCVAALGLTRLRPVVLDRRAALAALRPAALRIARLQVA